LRQFITMGALLFFKLFFRCFFNKNVATEKQWHDTDKGAKKKKKKKKREKTETVASNCDAGEHS
jgi:hypothetical protein